MPHSQTTPTQSQRQAGTKERVSRTHRTGHTLVGIMTPREVLGKNENIEGSRMVAAIGLDVAGTTSAGDNFVADRAHYREE